MSVSFLPLPNDLETARYNLAQKRLTISHRQKELDRQIRALVAERKNLDHEWDESNQEWDRLWTRKSEAV